MSIVKLGAAFVASLVVFAAVPPASAASPTTDAFLANVRANVDFLDRSSRIATERAAAPAMRDFAAGELAEAMTVGDALDIFTPSDHRFAATAAAAGSDGLVTGRSARVEVEVKPAGFGQSANTRMPMGSAEIARLQAASGRGFDDLYWEKQLDALSQLRADYRRYIAAGDDTALRALARRELPNVENRLRLLTKI